MYFQFLVEDRSGTVLIEAIMQKLTLEFPDITYSCKPFHGIGGFPKGKNAKDIKTGQLLNDLAIYLRGFNKSLQGFPAVIVVVVDNDDRDTESFVLQLEKLACENMISVDHVFCVAVEETEAWLLGDKEAILTAYPKARMQPLRSYVQDSICGTWEVLADVVYKGGYTELKRRSSRYAEIGELKCEWSRNIGPHMNIHKNESPSFSKFIDMIEKRLTA